MQFRLFANLATKEEENIYVLENIICKLSLALGAEEDG